METLGTLMREQRACQDMTLRGLARALDMSASHISNLENDKQPPGEETLENILKALGVARPLWHRWFAAAGIIPGAIRSAMLTHPEAWPRVATMLESNNRK